MNKHSMARKKSWSKVSMEERSSRMRKLALVKWKNMSPIDKKKQMDKMNEARLSG